MLSLLLFVGFSLFVLFFLIEIALRFNGVRAGYTANGHIFKEVDSLYIHPEYMADEEGVLKFSPLAHKVFQKTLAQKPLPTSFSIYDAKIAPSVQQTIIDFGNLDKKVDYNTDFSQMITQIRQKPSSEHSDLDSAYLNYAANPFNPDGFKSIEFKQFEASKKNVLLLGDSFTWGASAKPLTASFADLLATKGYAVYNTGIIAMDPAQYEHLAKKYIPLLQPDYVVLNFYMGNDIMWWERQLKPYQFPYYPTNAGWLWADPKKEYLPDVQTTYEYIKSQEMITNQSDNRFSRFCAATALGTKLWMFLGNLGMVKKEEAKFKTYNALPDVYAPFPVSENHIKRIQNICNQNNTPFIMGIIPDIMQENKDNFIFTPDSLFKEVPFEVLNNLSKKDYQPLPDAHFNNEGHRKYAAFLDSLINALPLSASPQHERQ